MNNYIFEKIPIDEKETIILVDNFADSVELYTTDKKVFKKLFNKLGMPNTIYKSSKEKSNDNYISGVSWKYNYFDNREEVKQMFQISNILPRKKAITSDILE